MVKSPVFPASRTVTGLTLDSESTSMPVVFSMAGDTGDWGILESFCAMTFFTFHFYMLA